MGLSALPRAGATDLQAVARAPGHTRHAQGFWRVDGNELFISHARVNYTRLAGRPIRVIMFIKNII